MSIDIYTAALRRSTKLTKLIVDDVAGDDPVHYWSLLADQPDTITAHVTDVYVESVDGEHWLDVGHRRRLVTGLLTAMVDLDGIVHGDHTETAFNVAVAYTFTGEYTAGEFTHIGVERVA